MRRVIIVAVFLLAAAIAWWIWPRDGGDTGRSPSSPSTSVAASGGVASSPTAGRPTAPPRRSLEEDFPIAAPLNKPGSTIARDLDTLGQLFDAWRSNFPREGNPVGENSDITAALSGKNSLELVLVPKDHPAINAAGELCDRWGTPFRFHQLSGERMEIRSAGPDRKFATEDDTLWTPP